MGWIGDSFKFKGLESLFELEFGESELSFEEVELSFEEWESSLEEEVDDGLLLVDDEDSGPSPHPAFNKFC